MTIRSRADLGCAKSTHKEKEHEQKDKVTGRSRSCRADWRWRFEQPCGNPQHRVEEKVIGTGEAGTEGLVGTREAAVEGLFRVEEGVVVGAGGAGAALSGRWAGNP